MNQETLNIAMKEAVKVGLFPKAVSMELYTETWEGMRSVLEVVEQNNPDVISQRDALTVLANKWTAMSNEQIPPEYKDRGLDHKYLRLDNEAAGLSNCAEELLEALKES